MENNHVPPGLKEALAHHKKYGKSDLFTPENSATTAKHYDAIVKAAQQLLDLSEAAHDTNVVSNEPEPDIKQQVNFTLAQTDNNIKVKVEFTPALVGEAKYKKLTDEEKAMQSMASHVGNTCMQLLAMGGAGEGEDGEN